MTQCLLRRKVDWSPKHRKERVEGRHEIRSQECCWFHPKSTCKHRRRIGTRFRFSRPSPCIHRWLNSPRQQKFIEKSWQRWKVYEKNCVKLPKSYLEPQIGRSPAALLSEGRQFGCKIQFCGQSTSRNTLHLRYLPRNPLCWTLWRHHSSTCIRERKVWRHDERRILEAAAIGTRESIVIDLEFC